MRNPKTGKAYLHHRPSKPLAEPEDRSILTNEEIVSRSYELIRTCTMYQMSKFNCPESIFDDVVQDVAIVLLESDNEKLNKIYWENHLNAWISGILTRQLYSVRSQTWKIYRKFSYLAKKEISDYVNEEECKDE